MRDIITSVWEMQSSSGHVKRLPGVELDGSPFIISKVQVIAQTQEHLLSAEMQYWGRMAALEVYSDLPQPPFPSSPWHWEVLWLCPFHVVLGGRHDSGALLQEVASFHCKREYHCENARGRHCRPWRILSLLNWNLTKFRKHKDLMWCYLGQLPFQQDHGRPAWCGYLLSQLHFLLLW